MGSLSNLYISQSYQSLAHLGTNTSLVPGTMTQLQDGIGQSLNIYFDGTNISSSGNIYGANLTASVVDTGSFVTTSSFNAYTATQDTKNTTLATYTASVNQKFSNIESQSGSWDNTQLNAFSASQLTKDLTLASYTGSNDIKWSNIGAQSGSWVTESETGSFARTDVTNTFTQPQIISAALTASFAKISGLNYPTVDDGVKSVIMTDGAGNLSLQYVDAINDTVYNGEATTIVKGTPLYVSGSQGANPKVYRADASNSNKMPVIYIAADNITSGNTGRAVVLGEIDGVTTTGYPAGTEIYVAEGGGWTSNRPSGSNSIVQPLGIVTQEGVGGKGIVLNPGPVLLPNLQTGYAWVGNGSNQPTAVTTSSFGGGGTTDLTSLNAFTASQNTKNSTLETYTASVNTQLTNLSTSQSIDNQKWINISAQSGSWGIASGSVPGGTVSSSAQIVQLGFLQTSSFQAYTASQDTKNITLAGVTSSLQAYTASQNTINQNVSLSASIYETKFATIGSQSGSWGGSTINTGSFITTGSATTASQTVLGDFKFDTTFTATAPLTAQDNGTNVVPISYGDVFGTYAQYFGTWLNTGFAGVTVSGTGITNGAITGYNFSGNFEVNIVSGNITSGQTYTFTGPATQTIDVTGSVQVTGELKAASAGGNSSTISAGGVSVNNTTSQAISMNPGMLQIRDDNNVSNLLSFAVTSSVMFNGGGTWQGGPQIAIYKDGTGDVSTIGFESSTNWTDGRVTILTPLVGLQNLELTGSLTASLQQGYVWVGGANGKTTTVATSSFGGSLPAGIVSSSAQILAYNIFATTGSNTFNGNQNVNGDIQTIGGAITSSNGFISPGGLTIANVNGTGIQYGGTAINVNVAATPTDIFATHNIDGGTPETIMKLGLSSYTSEYPGQAIPAIFGGGSYNGSDTAIAFYSSSINMWMPTNVKSGLEVTGSTNIQNLTASLQQGYVWVGNANGKTTTVATSSFGGGSPFPFTGNAVITGSLGISGSMFGGVIALSVAVATASVDFSKANMFTLTLPSASTHINPTNIRAGQTVNIQITQPTPGTGSVTFPANVKFAGGNDYQATTTGSAIDMLTLVSYDGVNVLATSIKNFL